MWCGVPELDRGLRDRGDPAPCGANRQLPMRAQSSTGWVAGRPDTTAGSQPISIISRPTSDPPRTASLTSKSPAPVPDAETLSPSPSRQCNFNLHPSRSYHRSPVNHPRYDALNRLTQKSFNDGSTPTTKYGYDAVALTGCTPAPPSLTISNGIG